MIAVTIVRRHAFGKPAFFGPDWTTHSAHDHICLAWTPDPVTDSFVDLAEDIARDTLDATKKQEEQ